jgi:hypothetical protein
VHEALSYDSLRSLLLLPDTHASSSTHYHKYMRWCAHIDAGGTAGRWKREREREREQARERQRETEGQPETGRQRETETHARKHTHTQTQYRDVNDGCTIFIQRKHLRLSAPEKKNLFFYFFILFLPSTRSHTHITHHIHRHTFSLTTQNYIFRGEDAHRVERERERDRERDCL